MDTVVLSTLLFNTVGIVAFALGMAVAYCLPERRSTRRWIATDADAAAPSAGKA